MLQAQNRAFEEVALYESAQASLHQYELPLAVAGPALYRRKHGLELGANLVETRVRASRMAASAPVVFSPIVVHVAFVIHH